MLGSRAKDIYCTSSPRLLNLDLFVVFSPNKDAMMGSASSIRIHFSSIYGFVRTGSSAMSQTVGMIFIEHYQALSELALGAVSKFLAHNL